MKIHGYDTAGYAGLLRFELALKRQFMKDNGYLKEKYITSDNKEFSSRHLLIALVE